MNFHEMARAVAGLREQVETLTDLVVTYGVEAAEAEHDFKLARARCVLSGTGSVASREARAIVDHEDLHHSYIVSSAKASAYRETLRAKLAELSATQSLASAHRAEAELTRGN